MEMPKELRNLPMLIALNKVIETFNKMCEDSKSASPEIRAFVKGYEDKVVQAGESLRSIFGDDFLD